MVIGAMGAAAAAQSGSTAAAAGAVATKGGQPNRAGIGLQINTDGLRKAVTAIKAQLNPAKLTHATLVGIDGQVISWTPGHDSGDLLPPRYSSHMVAEMSASCEEAAGRLRGQLNLARLVWNTGDVVMVWDSDRYHFWQFWPGGAPPDGEPIKSGQVNSHHHAGGYPDNREIVHAAIMFGFSILNPTRTPDEKPTPGPNDTPIFP